MAVYGAKPSLALALTLQTPGVSRGLTKRAQEVARSPSGSRPRQTVSTPSRRKCGADLLS
jgi:hypothetical protein